MAYHKTRIPKGVIGEHSKITEECLEFMDAVNQDNQVLVLCELADLVGAVQAFLAKHHPTITLSDLETMAEATKSAFESGERK